MSKEKIPDPPSLSVPVPKAPPANRPSKVDADIVSTPRTYPEFVSATVSHLLMFNVKTFNDPSWRQVLNLLQTRLKTSLGAGHERNDLVRRLDQFMTDFQKALADYGNRSTPPTRAEQETWILRNVTTLIVHFSKVQTPN